MGYNCWITRAAGPNVEPGGVGADEVRRLIEADPELEFDPQGELEDGSFMFWWNAHPTRDPDESCLTWDPIGQISADSPDMDECAKLLAMAQQLNARFIGEDGEELTIDRRGWLIPFAQIEALKKPWWRRVWKSWFPCWVSVLPLRE